MGAFGSIFGPREDITNIKQDDVVDNLTSTSAIAPLSANQGKVLETAKANKTVPETAKNLAGLKLADGDLEDSGITPAVGAGQFTLSGGTGTAKTLTIDEDKALSAKADKVSGATEDNVATFDGSGNIQDSGFTIYVPDTLRASVENATGGRCTVLYDDLNLPNYMHIIPAMNAGDLIAGLTGAHPAFLVNGTKIGEIFVGMYPASMIGTRAYSLPRVAPEVSIDFDDAKAACTAKGSGWHLMTNWEWAAIALWCVKNSFEPRGNTNHGRHHTNVWETGIRQDAATYLPGDSSGVGNILAGSGPNSWRHNGDSNGIADLVGNVWEWVDGFKIDDGRIYMPTDNNIELAEASWPAMDHYLSNEAGTLTLQDTAATVVGATISVTWASLTKAGGYTESDLLKAALISPAGVEPSGTLSANTSGERMPLRGGSRYNSGGPGLGALILYYVRGGSYTDIGFRPAFLSIP